MRKILDYLQKLGFSEVEAKLYLKLLKSGQMSVTELAHSVGINRTAAYAYINSLLNKGVIAKLTGKSSKLVANPPEHLQYLVEQKITETSMLKETFPSILSALYTSLPQQKDKTQSDTKYYRGRTGVKAIYEEVLRSDKIRSYFNAADIDRYFLKM